MLYSYSEEETLALVEKLSLSSKVLSEEQILSLALKIPDTVSLDKLVSIASEVPFKIFDKTNIENLTVLVKSINLKLLDDSKKSYIGISVN